MMKDKIQATTYDSYNIGGKSYVKDTYLGPKAWGEIQKMMPGRFVDILESKFANNSAQPDKSVDLNK